MSQNKKIFLLVDDDGDDRSLFYEALQSIDPKFICFMAEDGRQALNLLAENTGNLPNVIFLDINMPVISGWQCLKSLKTEPLYKNIPVIMYSTSSHQRDMEIAIELGALCFCVKPENFKKIYSNT